jgi:hypothetical protein
LRRNNFQDEEKNLVSLAEKAVPVAPLCRYMNSRFNGGSEIADSELPTINGLEGLVLQNLLVNSYQHGFPLSDAPDAHTAETTHDPKSGRIKIWDYSEIKVFRAAALARAFYQGRGLFIADLYATIAERPFDINCREVQNNNLDKDKKYMVIASF